MCFGLLADGRLPIGHDKDALLDFAPLHLDPVVLAAHDAGTIRRSSRPARIPFSLATFRTTSCNALGGRTMRFPGNPELSKAALPAAVSATRRVLRAAEGSIALVTSMRRGTRGTAATMDHQGAGIDAKVLRLTGSSIFCPDTNFCRACRLERPVDAPLSASIESTG